MNTLKGTHIRLRALEPEDLDFLYRLENDETLWEVSNTITPYSKYVLKQYLENAHRDIYEVKQVRLVICPLALPSPVGFIDLFDFDPKHRKVGVGIVIFAEEDRRKGYAKEALALLCRYTKQQLGMHQVYANITEDNKKSITLFEKAGFELSGVKKDWVQTGTQFKNELFYQLIFD